MCQALLTILNYEDLTKGPEVDYKAFIKDKKYFFPVLWLTKPSLILKNRDLQKFDLQIKWDDTILEYLKVYLYSIDTGPLLRFFTKTDNFKSTNNDFMLVCSPPCP